MERLFYLPRIAVAGVAVIALAFGTTTAAAGTPRNHAARAAKGPKSKAVRTLRASGPMPWCAEELETLPNGLCYINGGQKEGRRTLVVFLHGAIAKDVDWQW